MFMDEDKCWPIDEVYSRGRRHTWTGRDRIEDV